MRELEGLNGLASSHSTNTGGEQMDDKLIKFFATDFTKNTKTPLKACPSTDNFEQSFGS
jgi:heat shock protein 1/8